MEIDLNCDLGEGYPFDAELMPLITSANISCGAHAGDSSTMLATLKLAGEHGVQVGAHPGYADRDHFGRRELDLREEVVFQECHKQVKGLTELALAHHLEVRYLKPHGALYNQACRSAAYARPVVRVAKEFGLAVMGLPNSELEEASKGHCPFVAEGFADRRYLPDGTLVPRSQPNAFVEDPAGAVCQAERLIQSKRIQTLCVHGDNPQAVVFVKASRSALLARGITIRPFRQH
jgi:UPF0271 protein